MNQTANKLSKYLGISKDDYSIVVNSNKGISADAFFDLADISGIKKNILSDEILDISLKTLSLKLIYLVLKNFLLIRG